MPNITRAIAKTAAAIALELPEQGVYFDAFPDWESGVDRIYELAESAECRVLTHEDWHQLDWYQTTTALATALAEDFESHPWEIAARVLNERKGAML